MGYVSMAAITGTTMPHLSVKSLRLIWRSSIHRFHQCVSNLRISCGNLTQWHGTSTAALAMAHHWHAPLAPNTVFIIKMLAISCHLSADILHIICHIKQQTNISLVITGHLWSQEVGVYWNQVGSKIKTQIFKWWFLPYYKSQSHNDCV